MKKFSIILILMLIAMIVTGCSNNTQSNKMNKQVKSGNSVKKVVNLSDNPKVVKKVQHDVLGYGNKQTIVLSVYEYKSGAPLTWFITVDGQKILTLARDDYDTADIKFKDVDGDRRDEILVYRGSTGSAGAWGLNIYKPSAGKWIELFAAESFFDLPSKRFPMKYIGKYRVSFEDSKTGLKSIIPLEKDRYKGSENFLPKITSWVDPITDYEFKDFDRDGVLEIITSQRVIGISHPDTIALFKTMYKMQNQMYRLKTASLYDNSGHLLTKVELPSLQANNDLKIITDIKKYSLLMSSVQGIGLTPEFKTNIPESKVKYHWTASNGGFLVENKRFAKVTNSGEKLLWMPEFQKTSGNPTYITIILTVEDTRTGKILAETSLPIEQHEAFYYVLPQTAYVLKDTILFDKPDGKEIRNDITKGRVITVLAEQGDWTKILIYTYDTPDDNIGWVKSAFVTREPKGLTLREGRLKNSCSLLDSPPPKGKQLPDKADASQQVLIEERNNDWVRGQFAGGLTGWIPEKYVEFVGPDFY